MQNHDGPLEHIFCTRAVAKVLDVMLTGQGYTTTEISKKSGLALRTVCEVICKLRQDKLVSIIDKRGQAVVYALSANDTTERLKTFAYRTSR